MKEIKQHVQVPPMNLSTQSILKFTDPFVYASIKRYMNNDTKLAFPSLNTLIRDTGLSLNPIKESIARLELAGYIQIIKSFGKVNQYLFNDSKKFEIFSYDFLDDDKLTTQEKSLIVATQQYMFKNEEEKNGTVKFDTDTYASLIGISTKTLRRIEKGLREKNILKLVPSNQKELMEVNGVFIPKSGLNIYNRVYDFNAFSNLVALKFQEQDERLDEHEQELQKLKAENAKLQNRLEVLQKAVDKLNTTDTIIL